jgi:hypothetical protein
MKSGAQLHEGSGDLSNEELYELLADARRRYALHYLKQVGSEVAVRDLAEQVAARENRKDVADLSSQERKRVYISMYQSHLPTLDERGVVDYDADRGVVELTPSARGLDIYMEVVPGESIPWGYYYVGLSVASLVALALVAVDVSIFGSVSELTVSVVVVLVFSASSLAQVRDTRRSKLGDDGPPPDLAADWSE